MTVVQLVPRRLVVSPRLRRRQSTDRLMVARRMISEASHPARFAHTPPETKQAVARHLWAAMRHLRAASVLLEQAGETTNG